MSPRGWYLTSTPPPRQKASQKASLVQCDEGETAGERGSGKEEARVWVLKLWQWTGRSVSTFLGKADISLPFTPMCCPQTPIPL